MSMPKAGALLQKALAVFLVVVLLFNLYILLSQFVGQNRLPKVFGVAQVVVISGSMQPTIEIGDFLVIREQAGYSENDIITYRSGNSLITHRIKEVAGERLITQGDNNNAADAPIALSQVEGKVVLRIPKLGRAALFLKTPLGIVIAVFGGLLLIEVSYLAERRARTTK